MTSYDIYISNYEKTKVLQMPILPSNLPSISKSISNEEFETYWNGTFNFIEKAGLTNLSLEGWLPSIEYSFARSNDMAKDFIELFNYAIDNTEAIQILIICDGSTYLNDTFAINSFENSVRRNGDYNYSLSLKQWREYKTTITATKTYTVGWEQNSTGWYYYTDTSGNYYKDSWQLIENQWYYFNSSGYAKQSEWYQEGSTWYYLKDSCKMARNESITIDGISYSFNSSGSWIE